MKPYGKPIMAIMVVLLALIPAACGTELSGGVNAKTADLSSMVAGMASGGSEGSSSVAFMQGGTELNKNFQVNNAQLQSIINVLGGSIQDAVDSASNGDTIKVWPGLYKENVHVPISVIIQGSGALWTIVDGQQKDSVFEVGSNPEAVVTLSDMTIRNGKAQEGGGINNVGELTVKRCNIIENIASGGTGGYDFSGGSGFGGGMVNHGTAKVEDSIIRNNYADYHAGGIGNTGTVTVKNCRIFDNIAEGWGGGMCNHGTETIIGSVISQNHATEDGGGIWNGGQLTVINSIVSQNTANKVGGGIADFAAATIKNSLIFKNKASDGGGVYWAVTAPTITGSFIYQNSPNNVAHP
jgi:hypothetical protein